MKYKLIGEMVSNPTDNIIAKLDTVGSTLVHVVATSATDLILTNDGGAVIGRIHIRANGFIDLSKEATDTITCPTSFCTPIAYQA